MNDEKQKKVFLMKIGVSFFVILLVIVWVLNFKNIWQFKPNDLAPESKGEWTEIKTNIDQALSEINGRLDQIKEEKKEFDAKNLQEQELSEAAFIQDLIKETEKFASSTPENSNSTTTLPIIKSNPSCPAFINCMPSIGEARSCQIPAGCEGITQIAY